MPNPVHLEIVHADDGHTARIGGATIPLVTFAVEPAEEGGRAVVNLVLAVDSLSVGNAPTGSPTPSAKRADPPKPVPVWGAPGQPDPREGLPGWKPEAQA